MHQVNRDAPHSNFYYSLFRLWFTGVKTSNLNYIYWRGCLLNVVFFAISFFFMALLIRRFTDHWSLLSLGLLIAFINPASLSLTVFMRPYELQQTFVIILTYFVTCCIQAKQAGETIETKKTLAVGSVTLALTMLAAYINLILIGFYGLFIIIYCIRKKDYRLLGFFIMMFIAALIVAKLLYFDFGNLGYREQDATHNLQFSVFLANIIAMKNAILKLFFSNIFFGLFCLLTVIATICTAFVKKAKAHIYPILPAIAVINLIVFFVIMYLIPVDMKFLRYVAPIFPIFALSYISIGNRRIPKFVLPTIAALLLIFSLIQFNGKRSIVEHLDDSYIHLYRELQNTDSPIFLRGNTMWKFACVIPYLNDDSKIIFVSNFSEIPEKYTDKMPCIYIDQQGNDFGYYFEDKNLFIQRLNSIMYHDIYRITR